MNTFELIVAEDGVRSIKKTSEDGIVWWIPENESNTDYQAYLEFLEEGGQPLPADTGETL